MIRYTKPTSGDYAPYFDTYLAHLAGDNRDVLTILRDQGLAVLTGLKKMTDEQANYRYEAGKWSVKEVIGHVIDTERLFAFRALWIARAEAHSQPGMDENVWAAHSNAHERTRKDLWKEHHVTRTNHLYLFRSFDEAALARQGKSDGTVTSVNAIPWILAAHELHHMKVLRDRYGVDFLTAKAQQA